jgi:hypothetical protein
MKNTMVKRVAVLFALAEVVVNAYATPPIPTDLILADITACRKPAAAPPPLIRETVEHFNAQRRYIDLDGSGTCVLMDVWIERIGDSDSPGMRTLRTRFMHVHGGKWVPFRTRLQLFPFLLRSPTTGQAYLVVAPDEDIDVMTAGGIPPAIYTRGEWKTNEPTMTHRYTLTPVVQGKAQIYRTLAAQLSARTPADKQTAAERNRIRALQFAAGDVAADIPSAPGR